MNNSSMSQKNQNIGGSEKVDLAAEKFAKSPAFRKILPLAAKQWHGILAEIDEEKLNELLLIVDEEEQGYLDIKKKKERKLSTNVARYLQRLEMLRIRSENADDNQKQ